MEIYEITRSALGELLHSGVLRLQGDIDLSDVDDADYLLVSCFARFGKAQSPFLLFCRDCFYDPYVANVEAELCERFALEIGATGGMHSCSAFELWHVVDDPAPVDHCYCCEVASETHCEGCEHLSERFERMYRQYVEEQERWQDHFHTMDGCIEYVRHSLGDHVADFDYEGIAREAFGYDSDYHCYTLRCDEDDYWGIVAAYDLTRNATKCDDEPIDCDNEITSVIAVRGALGSFRCSVTATAPDVFALCSFVSAGGGDVRANLGHIDVHFASYAASSVCE